MSGYIITKTGATALEAFDLADVRYAAKMDNGTGFFAFGDVDGTDEFGDIDTSLFMDEKLMEPIPDYPPSWPDRGKHAPKRAVSNGFERFAIVSDLLAIDIMSDPWSNKHVTGAVMLTDGNVLLETDGFAVPLAIWTGNPTVRVDKRLLVPTG